MHAVGAPLLRQPLSERTKSDHTNESCPTTHAYTSLVAEATIGLRLTANVLVVGVVG
jgi:hypothetical protein